MIYPLAKAALFRLDPERAHHLALRALVASAAILPIRIALDNLFAPRELAPVEVFGLSFPNRVGLAAGYDKDGTGWRGLAHLGFGHIEVGTVTPAAQPGNPRPRVFLLPEHDSLVNRMGFPGDGAARGGRPPRGPPPPPGGAPPPPAPAGPPAGGGGGGGGGGPPPRLGGRRPNRVILGVNIGKQKDTPLADAAADYRRLVEVFAPVADYLAVNISSPNTPGLRQLQEPAVLAGLLDAVCSCRDELTAASERRVPILVKLAPDLDDDQLRTAVDVIVAAGVDGIIATNTTLARDGVAGPAAAESGGLSGAALTELSTRVIARIHQHTGGAMPIIGVGGIMSADDARAKIQAGASLVQLYTGLVYRGPGLVAEVARAIHELAGRS